MNKPEYPPEPIRRLQEYVASSVKEYRQKHNLSVAAFAEKCGLSAKRVARIETGTYELRMKDIMKLSSAIEVQASQLLRIVGL